MTEVTITALECPNCGAPVAANARECVHCFSPLYIHRLSELEQLSLPAVRKHISSYEGRLAAGAATPEALLSLGLCHYKGRMYAKAQELFSRLIEQAPDTAAAYYYLGLSLLQGKRPYMQTLKNIKAVTAMLETAIAISPEGRFYYFLYLLQKDFFEKKHLRNTYNAKDLAIAAEANGITAEEIDELTALLQLK